VCLIDAAPVAPGQYKWWWSTPSGRMSKRFFLYFYDCIEDAQANGYAVNVPAVVEHLKRVEKLNAQVLHR
jgi:hypothetical protein